MFCRLLSAVIALIVSAALAAEGPARSAAEIACEATEQGSQQVLESIAPTAPEIAALIRADQGLRAELGEAKLTRALSQLARFVQSRDPECREALRILGDTVDRVRGLVGRITLDGDPSEWSGIMPPAGFARLPLTARSESHQTWPQGLAAVVRDGRLYVMAGVDGAAYFHDPEHVLRFSVDCLDGPAWDARLSISCRDGQWSGAWVDPCRARAEARPLRSLRGAVGSVAELAIDVPDFALPEKTKPVWTLWAEARRKTSQGAQMFSCRLVPVYHEGAQPGVAAEPYVHTFLLLCADADLQGWERTAAAIAIMSATMFACGDQEVRRQVRADNLAMLALARELDRWQSEIKAQFRLKDYPLDAQLAWASRSLANRRYFAVGRVPSQDLNDRENYAWASTSPQTLRDLRTLAVEEGLVLYRCAFFVISGGASTTN